MMLARPYISRRRLVTGAAALAAFGALPKQARAAAHRYWRIEWVASSDRPAIAEVEMRTTPGGADQCSGGTASASSYSYFGSGDPAYAFDNDLNTRWLSNFGASPEWLQYDFGSGNDKEIVEIKLTSEAGAWAGSPTAGRVLYSDDGSSFTEAWTFSTPGWRGNGTSQTFGNYTIPNGSFRFLRARTTGATGSTSVACAELAFRETSGGAGAFSKSDADDRFWSDIGESTPSLGAPEAFDADAGTYFRAAGANQVGSLYAWKDGFEYVTPVEFAWTAWTSDATGQPSGTLYFEGSNDPYYDGWTEILAVTPGSWTAGQTQSFGAAAPARSRGVIIQ